jgi:hypothetical protein
MFQFKGNVSQIIRNDYNEDLVIFKVKKEEKVYKCRYNGFLPLDTNDAISLRGRLVENEVLITEKPLVIIPTNNENIKNCIFKAIRGKGIGPAKAEKVYKELYGRHESPNRDSKIISYLNDLSDPIPADFKFETLTKIQSIKLLKWWNRNFSKRRLYLLGLFDTEIRKSRMPDSKLFSTLKENPFKVISLSLEKAKQISRMFGKEASLKDIKAGEISRFINDLINRGWMGAPESSVIKRFPEFHLFKDYLEVEYNFVYSKGLIYSHHSFMVEYQVCERLNHLIRFTVEQKKKEEMLPDIGKGYQIFPEDNIVLTEEQETALKGSLNSYLSIITGGAGCGKTTLIKQLIKNFKNNDEKFILTSFTGKAVLRIKESLGPEYDDVECQTLHRIIYRKKSGQPVDKFYNIIIDECSMISTELMWEFFNEFKHKFRMILIGDCNQLPPIGIGSFFTQVINSERIPIYYLTQNKRMKQMGDKMTILENANGLINAERDKRIPFKFIEDKGFYLIENDLVFCYQIMEALKNKGVNSKDITVITPFNKDIDFMIKGQQKIFLGEVAKTFKNFDYYIGDRMMQTKNIYSDEYDLMNGEEGYITSVGDEFFTVDFGNGKLVDYLWAVKEEPKNKKSKSKEDKEKEAEEVKDLFANDIKHSFCKTVHKSQGSEYKYVILYLPRNISGFVNINLLYTAITRTKEKIWIVCDKESLDIATTRYLPYRYEKLDERLKEMRQSDEDILPNTQKKKIDLSEIDTVDTNDDIWDDYFEDDDYVPQEILDYYDN